jgi:integrase
VKTGYLFKKKRKSETQGIIYLALYLRDDIELISTGQRIKEVDWNPDRGYLHSRKHLHDADKAMTEIKALVKKAQTRLEAREQVVTPFSLKQEFLASRRKLVDDQVRTDRSVRENLKTVKYLVSHWTSNSLFKYQPSSQRSVRESMNQFLVFLDKSGNGALTRSELSPVIITAYERFLQEKKHLANNTHGKRMKHLRWFLKSINYDITGIKIRSNRKTIIALTIDELTALEKVDVSKSSESQKAKDLFVLGCYTGLRISDLKRITPGNIAEGKICMTLKKNKKEVMIPIVPQAMEILNRYNFRSPRLSEQVLNRTIKEVCSDAGIKQIVTIRVNVAGQDTDKQFQKFKLISSHTASKTFISLAPEWYGLTPAEVASIVGKDLKTLINHYYRLPRESAIKKMLQ